MTELATMTKADEAVVQLWTNAALGDGTVDKSSPVCVCLDLSRRSIAHYLDILSLFRAVSLTRKDLWSMRFTDEFDALTAYSGHVSSDNWAQDPKVSYENDAQGSTDARILDRANRIEMQSSVIVATATGIRWVFETDDSDIYMTDDLTAEDLQAIGMTR